MKVRVIQSMGAILMVIILVTLPLTSVEAKEKYPSKPINVYVGYAAGGSTDIVVRAASEGAKVHLGVPIAVINKPGAGTALSMEALKIARPDGYTIGSNGTSTFAVVRMGNANYDFFKDFIPICHLAEWISGFSVNVSSPWKTFQEFQAYAKANPGKIKYGITGPGNTSHLLMEDLAYQAGIKMVSLPTSSDTELAASLMGGHVQAAVTSYVGFGEYAKAGKTRLLVAFANQRLSEFPDVPTAKELGYNIGRTGLVGIVGPKGLSEDVVKTLAEGYRKALQDPIVAKALEGIHYPARYIGPEEYARECREYDDWMVGVMKRIGMIK